MPKKKAKSDNKKLRRQIEAMKAQLKSENIEIQKPIETNQKTNSKANSRQNPQSIGNISTTDDKLIKQDLYKTIILSVGAFAIIAAIRISGITSF